MISRYRRSILLLLRLFYLGMLVTAFYFGWQNSYREATFDKAGNYVVLFSYAAMLILFMSIYGGVRLGVQSRTHLTFSGCLSLFFSDFFIYLELCLIARAMLNPVGIFLIAVAQVVMAYCFCILLCAVYNALQQTHEVVAVYGGGVEEEEIVRKMESLRRRFRIVAVIRAEKPTQEIVAAIEPYGSVLLGNMDAAKRQELFNYCYRTGKRINIIPSSMDVAINVAEQTQIADTPILLCRNRRLSPEQVLIKRAMDLFFSLIGLVVALPFMLVIALFIKLEDGGPVFFLQTRLTKNGKRFRVIKFRSMRVDADAGRVPEDLHAEKEDERITKVGHIIRMLRMDELPQLMNIVKGEMSLVGPRPERVEHYELYLHSLPEFDLRLRAKAGLTGYAQVLGKYTTSPQDKLNLDLFYIENYSLLLDLRILFMTLKVLFIRESTEGFEQTPHENEP